MTVGVVQGREDTDFPVVLQEEFAAPKRICCKNYDFDGEAGH